MIINSGSNQSLGSNKYYYNQLDKYGKIIYNGFEDNIENMKTGTYIIDFGKQFNDLLNSDGGDTKLNIAFQSAWNAFTYDNMEVFYIDIEKLILTTKTTSFVGLKTHKVSLSNGNNYSYLKSEFSNGEEIEKKLKQINQIVSEMKKNLNGYSTYEKIKQVHNWLIDNVEYDSNAEEPYSISGALTEGKAVCEGYARSFKYIMDKLQIPCVLVSGTGTNSKGETESHAWNYVQLYGKWYAVDVTWDDPVIVGNGYITESIRYKNFLKGRNSFFSNHVEDGYLSANSQKFTFPELSLEDY